MRRGNTAFAGNRGSAAGGGVTVPQRASRPGHFRARLRRSLGFTSPLGRTRLTPHVDAAFGEAIHSYGGTYQYTAADFLTLPTLSNIPKMLVDSARPSAALADLTEGLMHAGLVHWSYWMGDLPGTIEASFKLFTESEMHFKESLEVLDWFELQLAQDVLALEDLYDAEATREQLEGLDKFAGKPMSAFALSASSDKRLYLGDALRRLTVHLKEAGCNESIVLGHIMGAIHSATYVLGGWSPSYGLSTFGESSWADEEEPVYVEGESGGIHTMDWIKIPAYFFSHKRNTAGLRRFVKKLEDETWAGAFWIIEAAYQLSLEMDRWVRDQDKGKLGCDHLCSIEHEWWPSLCLEWAEDTTPDALYHFNDMEMDSLYQCEHHNIQWLHVFDPTDPVATKKAVYTVAAMTRIVDKLDTLLGTINRFSQNNAALSLEPTTTKLKGHPLLEYLWIDHPLVLKAGLVDSKNQAQATQSQAQAAQSQTLARVMV